MFLDWEVQKCDFLPTGAWVGWANNPQMLHPTYGSPMRRLAVFVVLVLVLACTKVPPIYVRTADSAGRTAALVKGRYEVAPLGVLQLDDFKRAFEKRYKDQDAFKAEFVSSLSRHLEPGSEPEGPRFKVECPSLRVSSQTVSWSTMSAGGGPHGPPPMPVTHSEEFCVIHLSYRVFDPSGAVVAEGVVQESTSKGEILRPNQSKLENAVEGIQKHLVDYLRGRMPKENISIP